MRLRSRSFVVVASIATVACGLSQSQAARHAALSVRDYLQQEEIVRLSLKERQALELQSDLTKRRLEIKRSIVHDLLDGRVDLYRATEMFVDLNEMHPESAAATIAFPDCCIIEATAMQVMLHVRAYFEEHPGQWTDEVLCRLRSELEELRKDLGSTGQFSALVQ